MSPRVAYALRIILPAIWIGMIIAIDLIEAPLKFQAPGITIPLGLGIGRLVFLAMNIVELIIAITLAVALWHPRSDRRTWMLFGGLALVLAIKLFVVRPLLAQHTNAVLAGESTGGSTTHYFYIAADAVIGILLVWFLVAQVRRILPKVPVVVE
ncbi:hypothetical protein [Gulosibacter molinativorax]|uniref:Uncharacterized protein n=1 Tax=Gulosibacter molinativorax TaxID=256821 RepID=A0ABT7C5E7_9MICO|nr:hypothetical protein [Gulosibacter molinativorax]MDJ1370374.1 hypothetical protein [Gulosibacter molinativorax]QUY61287.1 Membrane protein [Gulosibacter molinativorax]